MELKEQMGTYRVWLENGTSVAFAYRWNKKIKMYEARQQNNALSAWKVIGKELPKGCEII